MKNMKKAVIIAVCCAVMMSVSVFANGVKQIIDGELNTVNIEVNGVKIQGENILYNDRTYVPLREIAGMLGKVVTWDDATYTAKINDAYGESEIKSNSTTVQTDTVSGKQSIEVELNTVNIEVNGDKIQGENILYNDRTYVPLREIAEMLGKTVTWDDETYTAGIIDGAVVTFEGEAIGKVGDKDILKGQLDMYVSIAKAENPELTEEEALAAAKENIVNDETIILLAKEQGVEIDDEFISNYNAYVDEINAAYAYQLGVSNAFEFLLNEIGYTVEAYQRVQEIEYLKSLLCENDFYTPTDDEITDFYEKNKESFKYDGLTAKHILFSVTEDMTESQVKSVENKANGVYNRIIKGEDFDSLMNEYSEDPGLAANPNGYVFTRGEMIKEFEDAAYALDEGEVSKPVKSVYGYHIIKLVEKIDYFGLDNAAVIEYIDAGIRLEKLNKDVSERAKSTVVSWE